LKGAAVSDSFVESSEEKICSCSNHVVYLPTKVVSFSKAGWPRETCWLS